MLIDLLTQTRRKYSEQHPDRDTRQMPVDDTLLAAIEATDQELKRLHKQIDRLERKMTAGDPE